MACLQLAGLFQQSKFVPQDYQSLLLAWASKAKFFIKTPVRNLDSFRTFIRYFYVELAFSGDELGYFSSRYNLLNKVFEYRTGIPITLSIIFQQLAKQVGFDVCGVNFPGHFLLKCRFEEQATIYLDPLNGNILQRQDLERMYFSILTEIEDETMPEEALNEASCSETVISLLHNLKASYIKQKCYSKALDAVQLLVELCPNDPYERRDRGFLLYQLDCTQVAMTDYQYFIRQCPDDPSSQLLQAQLQQLAEQAPEILH
nr:tetratricopeptide repeat protein [Paraglaciecola sp. G1-23]